MNWDHEYAQHRRSLERIVARENKVKDDQKEILQRCNLFILIKQEKDANRKVHSSSKFKQKEVLSRIIHSNQILSRKIQDIEKRKLSKYQEATVRISTMHQRQKFQQEVALENRKMEMRMNKLKPAVHTL
ncbi:hypothetical protein pb186bvf_011374 [Paramecium bursaria]